MCPNWVQWFLTLGPLDNFAGLLTGFDFPSAFPSRLRFPVAGGRQIGRIQGSVMAFGLKRAICPRLFRGVCGLCSRIVSISSGRRYVALQCVWAARFFGGHSGFVSGAAGSFRSKVGLHCLRRRCAFSSLDFMSSPTRFGSRITSCSHSGIHT